MKGHNYGICKKCGKLHSHPKGMLGKSNKGVHLGSVPWNKGKIGLQTSWCKGLSSDPLSSNYDSRVAKRALPLRGRPKPWQAGDKNVSRRLEVRNLLSVIKKAHPTKIFGNANPAKREDVRKKISMRLTSRSHPWQIGDNNPSKRPDVKEKIRRRLMERPVPYTSSPQIKLYSSIKKIFSEAKLEYPVRTTQQLYFLDIALPSFYLDIEYDGEFYHRELYKGMQRDIDLALLGWVVARFREVVSKRN